MNNGSRLGIYLGSLALLVLLVYAVKDKPWMQVRPRPGASVSRPTEDGTPEQVIAQWPARQRALGRAMLEKYGRPNQFDQNSLVWFNNGFWKRTIVYRRPPRGRAKAPEALQQTIAYLVPHDRIPALKTFDPALEVSPTAGEISYTSDSEAKNRLALNLADEVVTGRRTAAQARRFFDMTSRLSLSGKSSPYMDKLMFEVDNTRAVAPTGADR